MRGPSRPPPQNGSGDSAIRDWDLAMARLFPLRRKVTRITIVVDGQEEVLFES
jgi:hypothetical protein